MEKRVLGRSGISVSPMGLGCWAIGGPFYMDDKFDGYGQVDDNESIQAIRLALDNGINFIDTSDAYGIGHSEEVIGKALEGRRDKVVIATKFGFLGNESTKTLQGYNVTPEYIERACNASLRRLKTDYIDLYQLHVGDLTISEIVGVIGALESLVKKGKIRTYGWSTDNPTCAKLISENENCSAIQHELNVIINSDAILNLCKEKDLASINRSPLGMGLLSGKFNSSSIITKNDVRGAGYSWTEAYFKDGKPTEEALKKLDAIRDILVSNGRTLAQGALAWIWAKSDKTIPIPGFRTIKQLEENRKAMEFGPLTKEQMDEIDQIIG